MRAIVAWLCVCCALVFATVRRRLAAQIALGIATLVKGVPLALAALHQAGAVAMLAPAVVVAHALR